MAGFNPSESVIQGNQATAFGIGLDQRAATGLVGVVGHPTLATVDQWASKVCCQASAAEYA